MRDLYQIVSATESEFLQTEEDDIDKIFSKLQKIEPPATLVSDILASVAALPEDIHTRRNLENLDLQSYTRKRKSRIEEEFAADEILVVRRHAYQAC